MAKFHISKKGNPEQCHAMNGNCPLSSNDEHYDSKEAAYVGLSESEKTVPEPAKRNNNDDGLYGGYSSSESKDLVSKGAVWKSNSSGYKLPNGSFIGVFITQVKVIHILLTRKTRIIQVK